MLLSFTPCRGYGRSALRNWVFQVSKDGQNWTTLYTHVDDCSLNEPGCDFPMNQSAHQMQLLDINYVTEGPDFFFLFV